MSDKNNSLFNIVLEKVQKNLERYKDVNLDLSDFGNEVGIEIGKYIIENNLDKKDFISGIEHGISLIDGTH